MANVLAPFGFRFISLLSAAAPNYAPTARKVALGNTTAIFKGDPVVQLSTGYIAQATAGTTQIAGIFDGCEYLSISQGRTVRSPYWPGSDAAADVTAFVIDTPEAVFVAQCNGGPLTLAAVGNNINFALGTGNTSNGQSGATVSYATLATTSTLPFRVINFGGNTGSNYADGPPGIVGNGSDGTTAYNFAYVAFNNQDYKSLTGI